jgi:hypothetical protein
VPRYHFDFEIDGRIDRDEEGADMPGIDAARVEAAQAAAGVLKDRVNGDGAKLAVHIRSATGERLLTVLAMSADRPGDD